MLKKKNIAMMMAVATVATTAAPAFAAFEKESVDEATLVEKVRELLDVKYSDPTETGNGTLVTEGNEHLNSVYEIRVGAPDGTVLTGVSDLQDRIEDAKLNSTSLTLYVADKGHKEVDGKIVASEVNKYSKYVDGTTLHTEVSKVNATVAPTVTYFNVDGTVNKADNTSGNEVVNISKAVIELANEEEIEVSTDDYKLNLNEPVDKNGKIVDTTGITASIAKEVVGFNLAENVSASRIDLPKKEVSKFVFGESTVKIEENLSAFVTEAGYTKKGVELVNAINAAKAKKIEAVANGKTYEIAQMTVAVGEDITAIKAGENGYEFSIFMTVNEKNKPQLHNVKIVINADSQKELLALQNDILAGKTVSEGNGTFATIAGDDRFETAVEISKKSFDTEKSADAVVLVGENAVVDGLAAAPLAAQKNAPILLSKKDAITAATMNEIKRVLPTNGTVYVVGGENTISKEVEKQLVDKLNANIVRVAGDDRYDTSLEIAKELTLGGATKAFVVGGNGLADAMSVAPVAANSEYTNGSKATPIIVTPEGGLTTDAKHFLDKNATMANVDVIGGTSNVSSKVLADLKEINKTVDRIAGGDRQETNAKVIDSYYGDGKIVLNKAITNHSDNDQVEADKNDIFVAQDGYVGGESKLIDALAVAPLAGKVNAPIVLATNGLSLKQEQVVDAKTDKHAVTAAGIANNDVYNRLTKIGGGVSSTPIQKLLKILGL